MFNIVMTVWLFHSLSTLVLFAVFGVDACSAMFRRSIPRVANSLPTAVSTQAPASAGHEMRRETKTRFPDTKAA